MLSLLVLVNHREWIGWSFFADAARTVYHDTITVKLQQNTSTTYPGLQNLKSLLAFFFRLCIPSLAGNPSEHLLCMHLSARLHARTRTSLCTSVELTYCHLCMHASHLLASTQNMNEHEYRLYMVFCCFECKRAFYLVAVLLVTEVLKC